MENIVRLEPALTLSLAERLTFADLKGLSVRICTGRDSRGTWIKYDIGNTGWTPPLYSVDGF